MKRLLKIVGVAGLLALAAGLTVAAYFAYQFWDLSRPAVSPRQLARLNSSMDTNSVRTVLGAPSSAMMFTNRAGVAATEWTYRRPSGWKFVAIQFGTDGKFERHVED